MHIETDWKLWLINKIDQQKKLKNNKHIQFICILHYLDNESRKCFIFQNVRKNCQHQLFFLLVQFNVASFGL